MDNKQTRREFVLNSSRLGLSCGVFAFCSKFNMVGNFLSDDVPDPKKLNYCGYVCPADCPMYVATIENNDDKKKEAYITWKIEERHGVAFDPGQVFCYGCKSPGKPEGIVLKHCTVRQCAIEKGYDCCIACDDLPDCDLDLWKRFPEFHKAVIEMQKIYKAAEKS
jgi:hypothetical protein